MSNEFSSSVDVPNQDVADALRQSHSLVLWREWSEESFALADKLKRPIFLSLQSFGSAVSTRMIDENFDDEETAEFLNQNFICISVDALERPDLEDEYREYLLLIGARENPGLMNVFLNHLGQPFCGGGFFPHEPTRTNPSFLDVCRDALKIFGEESEETFRRAASAADAIRRATEEFSLRALEKRFEDSALDTAKICKFIARFAEQGLNALEQSVDPEHGGIGGAPRDLHVDALSALLNSGDKKKSAAAILTLDKIRCGAITDQVGGGVFSACTDARWMNPRLEKTLVDNAQLLPLYAQAAEILCGLNAEKSSDFEISVEEIFSFLQQEMCCPKSGLYISSVFADHDDEESGHFVFDFEAVAELFDFNPELREFGLAFWGVTRAGNYKGSNALSRPSSLQAFCGVRGIEVERGRQMLAESLSRLRRYRQAKSAPRKDQRVVLSDNAIAIVGFIRAGVAMGQRKYIDAALLKMDLLWSRFVNDSEVPAHLFDNGVLRGQAFADDLAALLSACTEAFLVTHQRLHLDRARQVVKWLHSRCVDPGKGTLFYARAASRLGGYPLKIWDGKRPSAAELAFESCRKFLNHAASEAAAGFEMDDSELRMWEALELVALATFAARATVFPHLYPTGMSVVRSELDSEERV
ncbi:MAG: thioredoxin domain-containing protein [Silvanigrellaceae bacterium]